MDKQKWTCIELDWISFPFQRTTNLIYTQHSLAPFLLMSQKIEIKGTLGSRIVQLGLLFTSNVFGILSNTHTCMKRILVTKITGIKQVDFCYCLTQQKGRWKWECLLLGSKINSNPIN